MGNTNGVADQYGNGAAAPIAGPSESARVNPCKRYSAQHVAHAIIEGRVHYEFLITPPEELQLPGHVVNRRYSEFQRLDEVVAQRHRELAPDLPAWTFFNCIDEDFLSKRAAGLQEYLNLVLELEPLPRLQVLRRFLGIVQPLPLAGDAQDTGLGEIVAGRWRLPVGVVAQALGFCHPLWVLRVCSPVCKKFCTASHDARCWPSIKFRSSRAERWLEPIFSLLAPTCGSLTALTLDLGFESPQFAAALPGGLQFPQLRRLSLRLADAEAVRFGSDLLACVDSPCLQRASVEGGELTSDFLAALCTVALSTQGKLVGLSLSWAPEHPTRLWLDEEVVLVIVQLLEVVPALEACTIGISSCIRDLGHPREMAPLQPPHVEVPGTIPLLANMAAMAGLRALTFDFLSDDVLACLRNLTDRSLPLRSAKFTGLKRHLDNPEDALVTLLSVLGDGLEVLSLIVEIEAEVRPFMQDVLRPRIGPLPLQFKDRVALRSLDLNWVAFDDAGVGCVVENCPRLHTLLLDRSEYWTDDAVALAAEGLPELQHFRVRASSMLSDRAVYSLADAAHKFVSLQIQPSYSMSAYALDQLRQRLSNSRTEGGEDTDFMFGHDATLSMIAAATDMTVGDGLDAAQAQPRRTGQARSLGHSSGGRRSSESTLQILKAEDEQPQQVDISMHTKFHCPVEIGW